MIAPAVRVLGEGVLTWPRCERVTDRYGRVFLMETPDSEGDNGVLARAAVVALEGRRGVLFAVVLATRDSDHIGDLFRGIRPSTPTVGERIELGRGFLVCERLHGNACVGLVPPEPRDSDHLDPRALYRVHSQTVRLEFEVRP